MPYHRPGSATAAGVLAIIYGSLFSLCGLCGVVSVATQGAGNNFMFGNDEQHAQLQKAMLAALDRDVPGYQVYQVAGTAAGLIGASLMLLAGIGVLYLRGWARVLAIADSLVLVALSLFQAVYQLVFVMPALGRFFQVGLPAALPQGNAGPPPADFLRGMQVFTNVMSVGTAVFSIALIVYLFIIVFLLSRRHVRAAFAHPVSDMYEERPLEDEGFNRADGDDEDDWDERRPRRDDWRDQ
jgi:hypothetical protein